VRSVVAALIRDLLAKIGQEPGMRFSIDRLLCKDWELRGELSDLIRFSRDDTKPDAVDFP
jgi:hypothetical protein